MTAEPRPPTGMKPTLNVCHTVTISASRSMPTSLAASPIASLASSEPS